MTQIVVVTSESCHLCEDALNALTEIGSDHPLTVREVPMESPEGSELFFRHRPSMPPAVFIDGALFSSGRLPRKKLLKFLERAA